MRLAAGTLACALSCWAQVGFQSVGGGLIYDKDASVIRPLLGIPGASRLGAGLGDGLAVSKFALGDAAALAVTTDEPSRARWLTAAGVTTIDVPGEVQEIYVNRAGTWGFLRTTTDELCYLDRSSSTCRPYRSGPVIAVVEERHSCLLVTAGEGAVERLCQGQGTRMVGKFSRMPSVLAWLETDKQLAAAFPESGNIEILRVDSGELRELRAPVAAIAALIAIDRQMLLVASQPAAAELTLLEVSSGAATVIPMPAAALSLRALPNDLILLQGDLLVLVDTSAGFESFLVPAAAGGGAN